MIKNTRELKQHNKYIVFNEIVERQPVSRKELSQVLDVSHATISSIIKELIAEGLIEETEFLESTGGRPPRLVEFRGDRKYVIAVEMSYDYISYAIYDLNFLIKKEESWNIENQKPGQIIKDLYDKTCGSFFPENQIGINDIIGIGISVPGIYNYKKDILTDSISEIWQNINIKSEFDKYFDLPLYIENDANLSAYYESSYGVGLGYSNILYIYLSDGIGSGLVINGELYKGTHGVAGEIGHTKVTELDYSCSCGRNGCLEATSSISAIKREVCKGLEEGKESLLQNLIKDNKASGKISIKDIIAAYQEGDYLCQSVINRSVDYLVNTLTDFVNFLDPGLIIIADVYGLFNERMIVKMNKKLNDLCYQDIRNENPSKIVRRTKEEFIQLSAAAKYVFEKWKITI